MAEFGEQLRKAREANGITQQTLAEQLYVTRQTVSRWECGERYPDLVTLKRLAQVLHTDVGSLLSEDENRQMAERTALSDNKAVSLCTLLLFAAVVTVCLISVIGTVMRLPALLHALAGDDGGILLGNLLCDSLCVVVFTAGFVRVLRQSFSAGDAGTVMLLFYAAMAVRNGAALTASAASGHRLLLLLMAGVSLVGGAAAYLFFMKKRPYAGFAGLGVAVLGLLRAVGTLVMTAATPYASADTALTAVLYGTVYTLFLCQIARLMKQRALAT